MELPEGNTAVFAAGEEQRIKDALTALAKDPHAPREITVRYILHIHNEYPKHVTVGKDKDGNAITKIVASEEEENAVLAAAAPAGDSGVALPVVVPAAQS